MLTDRSRTALTLCSKLALATALAAAGTAHAQSFQGTGTFNSGSGSITTGANTTTIDIATPDAVIDWTANDTALNAGVPINFQPSGTTATFQSTGDFSVLNRIFPTDASRPIQFNGTVISQLIGTTSSPGGTVFFYSPGGVIVGGTAVFNVGNLGLTSIAPEIVGGVFEQDTGLPSGAEFTRFNGAVTAGSAVEIRPGAVITSSNPTNGIGSYVALVAPVVRNQGTIDVDGVAALVSADAATITFNPDGLFDIQVTSGTSGTGSTLFNDGTITGPAFQGTGANHRIYAVAVPKNDAITLAISDGSDLGFDIAGAADTVGNAVVLSAGKDIVAGNIAGARSPGGGTGAADLNIRNSNITSALLGASTDETFFFSIGGNSATAASSVNLQADFRATFTAEGAGSTTTANGPVFLNADRTGNGVTAGQTDIFAILGGVVLINGNATLNSRGFGSLGNVTTPTGGNATGGLAIIQALTGGTVDIGGNVAVNANGNGGAGATGGGAGGNGMGGRAQVFASDSGSVIDIGGNVTITAGSFGGTGNGGGAGGTGTGGMAFLNAQVNAGALINITGTTVVAANGFGGNTNGGGAAGAAFGGTAALAASVNNDIVLGGNTNVSATGNGGIAFGGAGLAGSATGGNARVNLFDNGSISVTGDMLVISNGFTGGGSPNSASAQGGTTNVDVQQNSVLTVSGGLGAVSGGFGTGSGNPMLPPSTGSGAGGSTSFNIFSGGSVSVGTNLSVFSRAGGADGGNATGGNAQLSITGGSLSAPNISIQTDASGGGGTVAQGGTGTGGTSRLRLDGATLSGNTLLVDAMGEGGTIDFAASGNGGNGIGGSAFIDVGPGASTLTFTDISLLADGQGRNGGSLGGSGGVGTGGLTQISTFGGGSLTVNAPDVFLETDGEGGDSISLLANGGNGLAGRANAQAIDGSIIFNGNLSLSAESEGGDGLNGGNAFGDPENNVARAFVFARNASLTVTGTTSLLADAIGGLGHGTGNGGNANGGFAQVVAANGVNTTGFGTLNLADLTVDAGAFGGDAVGTGNGGNAGAGRARVFVNGGQITIGGDVDLFGDAFGGSGVNGGNAISPQPFREPRALMGSFNGTISVAGNTFLTASAFGGDALAGFGGAGGIGLAGVAAIDAQSQNGASAMTLNTLELDATGFGGDGGSGSPGQAGGAGGEGYGGFVAATGNAGRGVLTVTGNTQGFAGAFGGTGGAGGDGGTGTGAAGGVGGRAIGGGITFGTVSGIDTVENNGSATFANVIGDANAVGGSGGDGGTGATQGVGGNGGTGFGGETVLLVRGSPATFADVVFTASGTGGNGGAGSVAGNGGDGYGGNSNLIVTQRFMRTERGSLTANNVTFFSEGVAGAGAVAGRSFFALALGAESDVFIRQSNVTLNNLSITHQGDLPGNFTTTVLQVVDDAGVPVPVQVTQVAEPFDINLMQSNVSVAGALSITTPGDMRVSTDTSSATIGTLTLDAGNFVLPATRPATLGTFNVTNGLQLLTGRDLVLYANFVTPFSSNYNVTGNILFGDYSVQGALTAVSTGGTVTLGNVTATDRVVVAAPQAVTTGNISAGINTSQGLGKIAIGSTSGPVTTGNLAARGDLGIQSLGSISTGSLAGRDVLLLAGGAVTTGAITATPVATAPSGRIVIANGSLATQQGNVFSLFNQPTGPLTIFNNFDPTPTGGAINFTGAVQASSLVAATALDFTAGAITLSGSQFFTSQMLIGAGGLINVNGAFTGDLIGLRSNDIEIASTGSLTGGVELVSTNQTMAVIGDISSSGATQPGSGAYRLSAAEFGRISGGFGLSARDNTGEVDLLIGDLNVDASRFLGDFNNDGGISVYGPSGSSEELFGRIRVDGNLTITNAPPLSSVDEGVFLDFFSKSFEINAATGSVTIADAQGNLTGAIEIEADNIHIASDEILLKLRADPFYEGHVQELNAPASVQRPDGVLRAGYLELEGNDTIYIQNTGTSAVPAGFLTRVDAGPDEEGTSIGPEDSSDTDGFKIVINGQIQTDSGVLTGPQAFQAALEAAQADATAEGEEFGLGLDPESTFNSCVILSGVCASARDPVASISSEITVVTSATIDDSPTAPAADDSDEGDDGSSEEQQDEDSESDTGSSPIAPPTPLINTNALNNPVNVVEPVSGAGNPALFGSAVDEATAQGVTP